MSRLIFAFVVLAGAASPAGAAHVSRSVTIDASPSAVWEVVGPYCAISDWYPGIETCIEEAIEGTPHRRLETADGGKFLEKQLAHDDKTMSYSYAIIEGPLPVADYEATFTVSASGDDAVLTWSSDFEPDGVSEDEATVTIGGVYDAGLAAVKERFTQ